MGTHTGTFLIKKLEEYKSKWTILTGKHDWDFFFNVNVFILDVILMNKALF